MALPDRSDTGYRAHRPGLRRDNSGVVVTVTNDGRVVITNERNGTEVDLTQLHVAVLLDGFLERALTDAEDRR